MDPDYKVRLEVFEGPLDLLLFLIKRDEVDIHEISIDRIAKQFQEYLETFEMLDIALAGEFVVMAANLIYIKSRTLLPKHVQQPIEEEDEEDPRWELIRQLIEYKKFKDAATFLHEREEHCLELFANHPDDLKPTEPLDRPLADASIFDLIRALQGVLARFKDTKETSQIVDERYTVSDKIDHLLKTVVSGQSVPFSALFETAATKGEVIVTFLALLELMKLNHFRIRQDSELGEIELTRN
ncbi:MAG: segregation/condensation protein A [Verrucomicrobiales bacterium]|nr:segregation/condensation protein A [Verrucomicrobiae bacterium]